MGRWGKGTQAEGTECATDLRQEHVSLVSVTTGRCRRSVWLIQSE
jgi:hypothetical protein